MTQVASVRVGSRDLAPRVDACRKGSVRARAGYVERSDGSISIAHEAMPAAVPRDRPRRVDACRRGAARDRARSVERSDDSVFIAHEAVAPEVLVLVVSRDCPRRVDACSGVVPLKPAPGALNVVNVPSAVRTKPRNMKCASLQLPVISTTRVDSCRSGEVEARVRSVEFSNDPIRITYEAVVHSTVEHASSPDSRDLVTRVDACRKGSVRTHARYVERSDDSIFIAHEAVRHAARVLVAIP